MKEINEKKYHIEKRKPFKSILLMRFGSKI